MTKDVSDYLHNNVSLHLQEHLLMNKISPCCYKDWTKLMNPNNVTEGTIYWIDTLFDKYCCSIAISYSSNNVINALFH